MRALLVLAAVAALAGCATDGVAPEPQIRTVTVNVPISAPCPAAQKAGPAPGYVDTKDTLTKAKGPDEQAALLVAGRKQRNARLGVLEAAREACAK